MILITFHVSPSSGDEDSFNFQLDFLILFLSSMVECYSHNMCKLDALWCFTDRTEIHKINWCRYVVKVAEKCKEKWVRLTKSPFIGPLAILTVSLNY
jgi:hypothetical protein